MNKKILILIITLLVIIIAGLLLWIFWPKQEINPIGNNNENNTPVVCPQDAKQCPDGSYVSRTGPNCEFTECPSAKNLNTPDNPLTIVKNQNDFITYRDSISKIEITIPELGILYDDTNLKGGSKYSSKYDLTISRSLYTDGGISFIMFAGTPFLETVKLAMTDRIFDSIKDVSADMKENLEMYGINNSTPYNWITTTNQLGTVNQLYFYSAISDSHIQCDAVFSHNGKIYILHGPAQADYFAIILNNIKFID